MRCAAPLKQLGGSTNQPPGAHTQVQVAQVMMELDAYKEPWTYIYGRRSPTRDKQVAEALHLIPTIGRVLPTIPP